MRRRDEVEAGRIGDGRIEGQRPGLRFGEIRRFFGEDEDRVLTSVGRKDGNGVADDDVVPSGQTKKSESSVFVSDSPRGSVTSRRS